MLPRESSDGADDAMVGSEAQLGDNFGGCLRPDGEEDEITSVENVLIGLAHSDGGELPSELSRDRGIPGR